MAVHIIDEKPDLFLTRAQHAELQEAYAQAYQFYAGTPPDFETWARRVIAARDATEHERLAKIAAGY